MKRFLILYLIFIGLFELLLCFSSVKIYKNNDKTKEIFCTQKVIYSDAPTKYFYECKEIYKSLK